MAASFSTGHDDFVHDVAYDYYGKRIATASSDERIKVSLCITVASSCRGCAAGRRAPSSTHTGTLHLPPCALPRRARPHRRRPAPPTSRPDPADLTPPWPRARLRQVWEQDDGGDWVCTANWKAHLGPVWRVAWAHPEYGQVLASCSFDQNVYIWEEQEGVEFVDGAKKAEVRWQRKAHLADSGESVNDLAFAPRHMGLKLVRFAARTALHSPGVPPLPPPPSHALLLAQATASADGVVRFYVAEDVMNLSVWSPQPPFEADSEGASCLSWCQSRFDTQMIVVGFSGRKDDKVHAKVWGHKGDVSSKWTLMAKLGGPEYSEAHTQPVHDVAWAPTIGRSYHLIATASKDRTLIIWRLTAFGPDAAPELVHKVDLKSEVWRVEWNITGSVLASSSDDGIVRLWKQSLGGDWKCVTEVVSDGAAAGDVVPRVRGGGGGAAAAGGASEAKDAAM